MTEQELEEKGWERIDARCETFWVNPKYKYQLGENSFNKTFSFEKAILMEQSRVKDFPNNYD